MKTLLIILFTCGIAAGGEAPDAKIKAENAALKAENAALKAENAALKLNVGLLRKQLRKLPRQNREHKQQVASLKGEIARLEKQNTALESEGVPVGKWDGFRGIAWGRNLKSLRDMKMVAFEDDGNKYYVRVDGENPKKYGDFDAKCKYYYIFKNDKLIGGRIEWDVPMPKRLLNTPRHRKALARANAKLLFEARLYYGAGSEIRKTEVMPRIRSRVFTSSIRWSKELTPNLGCGNATMKLEWNVLTIMGNQ